VEPILLERHSAAGRAKDAGCTVILPAHTSLVEFWSMVPARMFLPGALEAHR
jgi:diacylglycerol kinase